MPSFWEHVLIAGVMIAIAVVFDIGGDVGALIVYLDDGSMARKRPARPARPPLCAGPLP